MRAPFETCPNSSRFNAEKRALEAIKPYASFEIWRTSVSGVVIVALILRTRMEYGRATVACISFEDTGEARRFPRSLFLTSGASRLSATEMETGTPKLPPVPD